MDDFYAARSSTSPPPPWSNFAPPFSPVDTLFDKLLTFITAASIMAGTIYFVFAVGLARPILTRSWRRDAWIGYLTAIGGFYLMAFTQL